MLASIDLGKIASREMEPSPTGDESFLGIVVSESYDKKNMNGGDLTSLLLHRHFKYFSPKKNENLPEVQEKT